MIGSAEAGSTVRVYTTPSCTGAVSAIDTAANLAAPGIAVSVADNSTTDFYATATDAAGNTAGCSSTSATYVEDSLPPARRRSIPAPPGRRATPTRHSPSPASRPAAASNAGSTRSRASLPARRRGRRRYTDLAEGVTYTFSVRQRDSAGNAGTAATRTFTVDTTGPTVTITSGPPALTNDSTPTFKFSSPALGVGYQCRWDSAAFATCSGPGASHTPATPLPDGSHTFSVRGVDPLSNIGPPDSRTITVNTRDCGVRIQGTAAADRMTGTVLGDSLNGLGGNDTINGLRGNDCLTGGPGNDQITGGPGNDTIGGGPGHDTISGGPGNDRINARDNSRDTIDCGPGRDSVTADARDVVKANCEHLSRPA